LQIATDFRDRENKPFFMFDIEHFCYHCIVKPPGSAFNMKRRKSGAFNPEAFLMQAAATHGFTPLRNKQVIFSQGDAADAIYYIQKGKVRISTVSKQGKEATLALLGDGDFVGEECVATSHHYRLTTATALAEGSMLAIPRAAMIALLKSEHGFSEIFVSFLLARNANFQEALADQLFNSSEKRLARILLQLAQVGKSGTQDTVVPKISQEMLAEMVGTTRARVNFFMNRFRKMGFVQYNGGLHVNSSLLNVILHD
jgi:CRP/FNR family transcriptional regulator, cyclic AMP receptor protein